jgi:putative transposase
MAVTRSQVEKYCRQHNMSVAATNYALEAHTRMSRDPIATGMMSVAVEHQSPKMGVTFNTESRTTELSFAKYLSYDKSVFAFFEQPPEIDCVRTQKNGVRRTHTYKADVLVLYFSGPVVCELKKEQELEGKILKNPTDWHRDGEYVVDLPAQVAFEAIGLTHRVVSSRNLSQVRTANVSLLMQAQEQEPRNLDALRRACRDQFANAGIQTLASLGHAIGQVDLTPLLHLINEGDLFVDLSRHLLADPNSCLISADPFLLREDVFAEWERSRGAIRMSAPGTVPLDAVPPKVQLTRAVEILDLLEGQGKPRSKRRWRAKIRKGEAAGHTPLRSVAPKSHLSGNRELKRPAVVLGYAEESIRNWWGNEKRPTQSAAYRRYKTDAEDWHPAFRPVSRPTYHSLLEQLSQILAAKRGGKRAAHAAESPSPVEERALRPTRPFELASCDHCLAKIYCVVLDANGVAYVDQPWLTVLRDCFTGSVLAIWLSFRPPSRFTCALIMRMCLRNHGRLPETIIVDRGAEFRSVYFSGLLAHCRVDLAFRPKSHPRYGQEAETFFNQFKCLWLADRPGNKVLYREARAVSGSHKPQNFATMELVDLLQEVLDFVGWNNLRCTDSQLESPAALMAKGLKFFSCSGKRVAYDDIFVLASCVEIGSYALDLRRGIHIGAYHYWHPKLGLIAPLGRNVEVRRDPENPYRVFARVLNEWVPCHATKATELSLRDPIYQLAEGIRVCDGGKGWQAAADDADRALVQALRRADARIDAKQDAALEPPSHHASKTAGSSTDLFAAVKSTPISPIKINQWKN